MAAVKRGLPREKSLGYGLETFTLEQAMSVQPISPNSGSPIPLVPKENRLRFVLYFVAATTLAALLSVPFIFLLARFLLDYIASFQLTISVPISLNLGIFDILSPRHSSQPGWVNWFAVLYSVVVQTILGALTGVLQWNVLRQYLPKGNWILATILGYQIAGLLAVEHFNPLLYSFVVCRGLFQWSILRHAVRDSWIWLLTYPFSLVVNPLLIYFAQEIIPEFSLLNTFFLGLLQAAVLCIFYRKSGQAIAEVD